MTQSSSIVSFIGGRDAEANSGGFDLVNPQDGSVIGKISEAGEVGVNAAVAAAQAAFNANRKSPIHQRVAWLKAAAVALGKAGDELAEIICADVGKPIRVCRFEAKRGVEFIEAVAAARLALLGGEPLGEPRHIWWNFVSSSQERIERAKADWKARRFPPVPGETELIPLPER